MYSHTGQTAGLGWSVYKHTNTQTRTLISVRSFTEQIVEQEKIEVLLRAAMSAPTAVNSQPWNFTVITQTEILKTLSDSLPYAKMAAKAPLAIIASGNMDKTLKGDAADYWIQDVSAAIENLLLAAHGLGLGAVWTGLYPINERVETVRNILGMPDNIVPLALIPIGYPDTDPIPKDKWNTNNIHWNKW